MERLPRYRHEVGSDLLSVWKYNHLTSRYRFNEGGTAEATDFRPFMDEGLFLL